MTYGELLLIIVFLILFLSAIFCEGAMGLIAKLVLVAIFISLIVAGYYRSKEYDAYKCEQIFFKTVCIVFSILAVAALLLRFVV